jgi:hypothetical protein
LQRATKLAEETGGGILLSEDVFGMRGQRESENCCFEEKYISVCS